MPSGISCLRRKKVELSIVLRDAKAELEYTITSPNPARMSVIARIPLSTFFISNFLDSGLKFFTPVNKVSKPVKRCESR